MAAVPFSLQPRDVEILTTLFECRVMTAKHIADIHFDGSRAAVKQRVRKLKAAGFLHERPRMVTEPATLFLTKKAYALLNERGIIAKYPKLNTITYQKRTQVSERTLRHELEVMDVKAAFHSTLVESDVFSVEEFTTWPMLNQFVVSIDGQTGTDCIVMPDGYIRLRERGPNGIVFFRDFFLEVDRSFEGHGILTKKGECYREYYKSGGFAARQGAPRSDVEKYPFRVLMVFQNAERRNNIAERLLQLVRPILHLTYLSTAEEIQNNALGEIWVRPGDYRLATDGTRFDPRLRPKHVYYKKDIERDQFIDANVKKFSILTQNPDPDYFRPLST